MSNEMSYVRIALLYLKCITTNSEYTSKSHQKGSICIFRVEFFKRKMRLRKRCRSFQAVYVYVYWIVYPRISIMGGLILLHSMSITHFSHTLLYTQHRQTARSKLCPDTPKAHPICVHRNERVYFKCVCNVRLFVSDRAEIYCQRMQGCVKRKRAPRSCGGFVFSMRWCQCEGFERTDGEGAFLYVRLSAD